MPGRLSPDVVSQTANLGLKNSREGIELDGFTSYYITEPALTVGNNENIEYPFEFRDERRFYTSDQELKTSIKIFVLDKDKSKIIQKIKNICSSNERKYKFKVIFEDQRECGYSENCIAEVLEFMKNISNNKTNNDRIILIISRKLKKDYYLVKGYGIRYKLPVHIVNLDVIENLLNNECKKYEPIDFCPALRAYLKNNYVQLYAKSGGKPWVVSDSDAKMLEDTVVIGLAASKLGNTGYIIGVSFSVAYMGKEITSYVSAEQYKINELDSEFLKTHGLYLPANVIEKILTRIKNHFDNRGIKRYVIFQSLIIHPEEIKGIKKTLPPVGRLWILAHVKASGFTKRIYDLDTSDYAPYRGLCLVDKDSLGGSSFISAILTTTGLIKIQRYGESQIKSIYMPRTTPRPIEVEILYNPLPNYDRKYIDLGITLYTSRLILLLNKLDWEAYTTWPKVPFVIKYANRIGQILATLYKQGNSGAKLAEEILDILQKDQAMIRYIM